MKTFLKALALLVIFLNIFIGKKYLNFVYDHEFYEHFFAHSQWNIPNSLREMPDEDLYKYVGYRIFREGDVEVNFEIPPLGKYLYGFVSHYFGNPYLLSFAYYLLGYFLVMKLLALNKIKEETRLFVGLLFLTTPLMSKQTTQTMLDLPLLFFSYLSIMLATVAKLKKLKSLSYLSFVVLGLAAAIKPPLFIPLFFIYLIAFLRPGIVETFKFGLVTFSSYMLSFFSFLSEKGFVEWLRLQKRMVNFYLSSDLESNIIDNLSSIFLNRYRDWWSGKITSIDGWSVVLPLIVIAIGIHLLRRIKRKTSILISALGMGLFFMMMLTPFYPRYFILVIPAGLLCLAELIDGMKNKGITYLLLCFLLILNVFGMLKPNNDQYLSSRVEKLEQDISRTNYRDLYRMIHNPKDNYQQWFKNNESNYQKSLIHSVTADVSLTEVNKNTAKAELVIKQTNSLGEKDFRREIELLKVDNEWMLSELNVFIEELEVDSDSDNKQSSELWTNLSRVAWMNTLSEISLETDESIDVVFENLRQSVPDDYLRFAAYTEVKSTNIKNAVVR